MRSLLCRWKKVNGSMTCWATGNSRDQVYQEPFPVTSSEVWQSFGDDMTNFSFDLVFEILLRKLHPETLDLVYCVFM